MWRTATDPARCDYVGEAGGGSDRESVASVLSENDSDATDPPVPVAAAVAVAASPAGVPLIRIPLTPSPIHELSRRAPVDPLQSMRMRSAYCIGSVQELPRGVRNFVPIQENWDQLLVRCRERFDDEFWKFFLKIHTYSGVVVDTTLRNVRALPFFPQELKKRFPPTKRRLMQAIGTHIDRFWDSVRHSYRIDLTQFELPSRTRFLDFHFIDPIWGWLLAASRHHPADLHWKPFAQHRTSMPTYGGGIQYGECFKQAHDTLPVEDAQVMAFTLHWDGTFGKGLDLAPIAIGVGNINNCDESKEVCISYMPFTPDQKRPEFRKSKKCTR